MSPCTLGLSTLAFCGIVAAALTELSLATPYSSAERIESLEGDMVCRGNGCDATMTRGTSLASSTSSRHVREEMKLYPHSFDLLGETKHRACVSLAISDPGGGKSSTQIHQNPWNLLFPFLIWEGDSVGKLGLQPRILMQDDVIS